MRYTPKILRSMLNTLIRKLGESRGEFVKRPNRNFTCPRTLTSETVISQLLTMSENSIGKVLIRRLQNEEKPPSVWSLFSHFTDSLRLGKTFCGYHTLSMEGPFLKSAACPEGPDSYRPDTPRQRG